MFRLLTRLAREVNWSRRRWSTATDRAFHEELYRSDDYDPFSLAYPGYTTIRRFADLVEPALPSAGTVVDLGCGPGEITCELAARRPDLSFIGIDHSTAAVAKAQANSVRRSASNARFECADVEKYHPAGRIDLVTLFDSFHHLTQPAAFVKRLGPSVGRWALIEPRGSWAGTWQKDLDFDWVAHDLDKIRAHIAALCAIPSDKSPNHLSHQSPNRPSPNHLSPNHLSPAAVERRYTLDDLRGFFDGYALDVRGTVAGLESYPPAANEHGELRERFGEVRYQLYRDIDDWLFSRDLDLHAKHWIVVAERDDEAQRSGQPGAGAHGRKRHSADLLARPAIDLPAVKGPYDVKYGAYRGPRTSAAGQRIFGAIELTNEGWQPWSSEGERGVFTSYHWLSANGEVVMFDGERTPLPRPIAPDETCEVTIAIFAPATPGRYRLAIDLVREGVTWFSQAGRPWLEISFDIR